MARTVLLLSLIAALVPACKHRPAPLVPDSAASADPEVEAAYRKGRDLFESGEPGLADEAFAALIREHPDDPLARPATIMRARIALGFGNPKRARDLLKDIKGDQDPVAERAMLYDGVARFDLGDYGEARRQLGAFEGRLADVEDNLTLYGTLWKVAEKLGDVEQAVVYIDQFLAFSAGGADHQSAIDALDRLVSGIGEVSSLERLTRSLTPGGDPWKVVVKRLASIHLEAGRFKESAALLEMLEKGAAPGEPPRRFQAVVEREQYPMQSDTIGLIVPLSKRARLVGETVVKGVMLGAKEHGLQVVIRDSASEADRAGAIVDELVKESHVAAIIGPLDGAVALGAAKPADALGVPMLALTPEASVPAAGPFVFREFMTTEAEISALVSTAKSLGYHRFAVLSPDNGYGRLVTDLFRDEVLREQLDYALGVSYPDDAKSFSSYAETLKKEAFEVLFVPDIPSKIALIAPALAAAGLWSSSGGDDAAADSVRPVQLLVPSVGFSKDLLRRAGRYLEGAIFSTFFFVTEALPGAEEFAERFHLEYGSEPNYLAAYGYDAAVLLAAALKSGAKTRGDVRRWLEEASSDTIDTTVLSTPFSGFTDSGEPQSWPWLFQVQNDHFELIRH